MVTCAYFFLIICNMCGYKSLIYNVFFNKVLNMIYDDKKFIGRIIREARKKAGLTQNQLAEAIDMSEKNLGNIENGKQFPQVNNFLHIIEYLKIPLSSFGVNNTIYLDETKQELAKLILTTPVQKIDNYKKIFELINEITN